ncbi:MAG: hypothetical protein COB46_12915 [Rhodospirillaceae bacterium]|nr:MAG: hypothetical protein COB46_12915 [Rhodospirillaceae bacterium]
MYIVLINIFYSASLEIYFYTGNDFRSILYLLINADLSEIDTYNLMYSIVSVYCFYILFFASYLFRLIYVSLACILIEFFILVSGFIYDVITIDDFLNIIFIYFVIRGSFGMKYIASNN